MVQKIKSKSAYWIGIPDAAYKKSGIHNHNVNETAYFRKGFQLSQLGSLQFKISGNSRYRLWVNGQPITSGPCKGDRWHHYYETVDVSEHLQLGYNCIAVKVIAYPSYESKLTENYSPFSVITNGAGPYLMVEGSCITSKGRVLADVTTGYGDWAVSIDKAIDWVNYPISNWLGAMEKVEGQLLPYGWKELPEPEGQWLKPEKRWMAAGNPTEKIYGIIPPLPLEERPIPLLYEKLQHFKREMPITGSDRKPIVFSSLNESISLTLQTETKYVMVLDAGELNTGYLMLKMSGGQGSSIRIRYAEAYSKEVADDVTINGVRNVITKKGIRDDPCEGVLIGHEDVYKPSGREETYEPFWFRTFRFIQLEIDIEKYPLTIEPPVYLETGYPLEVETSISSSTPWINGVWDISLRTLKRCMHETYEDCPYYEQLQYTMDTRSQILFSYMISGDTRLAQKALYDYHSSLMPNGMIQSRYPSKEPQVIPTFSIYFIFMIEDYYWQTGEIDHIKKYRSTVDSVLEWFNSKIGDLGLIENLGYWPFVDWVEEWEHGVPRAAAKGPSTIHNLLYAAGLQSAARLNELTGRKYIAIEYEKRAREILQQVESTCWSDKNGLFKEGPKFQEFSQHAQVWAVLTGLAKGKRAKSILKKSLALDNISICSYAMKFYFLRALEMSNLYDRSEVIWKDWQEMLNQHLTTCPEDSVNMRSDCHGWSALPLYEFTRCFLGVKPILPGWEKIKIKPKYLNLPDFSGSVITPKGVVTVTWKKRDGNFSISGQVPEGVPLELSLPDGTKQLYLNGGHFEF